MLAGIKRSKFIILEQLEVVSTIIVFSVFFVLYLDAIS